MTNNNDGDPRNKLLVARLRREHETSRRDNGANDDALASSLGVEWAIHEATFDNLVHLAAYAECEAEDGRTANDWDFFCDLTSLQDLRARYRMLSASLRQDPLRSKHFIRAFIDGAVGVWSSVKDSVYASTATDA